MNLAGLQRSVESCRLRWINYLRLDINLGDFSTAEENLIIQLHAILGHRWSQIAAYLPGRTDAQIENHWHSCLKKRAVVANQRHSEAPTMTLDQIATDDVDMDQPLQIDLYDLFTDSGAGFFESGLGK